MSWPIILSEQVHIAFISLAAMIPVALKIHSPVRAATLGFLWFFSGNAILFLFLALTNISFSQRTMAYVLLALAALLAAIRMREPKLALKAYLVLSLSGSIANLGKNFYSIGERFHEDSIEVAFYGLVGLPGGFFEGALKRGLAYPLALGMGPVDEIFVSVTLWAFSLLVVFSIQFLTNVSSPLNSQGLLAIFITLALWGTTPIFRILATYLNSHLFAALGLGVFLAGLQIIRMKGEYRLGLFFTVSGAVFSSLSRPEVVVLIVLGITLLLSSENKIPTRASSTFSLLQLVWFIPWLFWILLSSGLGNNFLLISAGCLSGLFGVLILRQAVVADIVAERLKVLVAGSILFLAIFHVLFRSAELDALIGNLLIGGGGWGSLFLFTAVATIYSAQRRLWTQPIVVPFILFSLLAIIAVKIFDGGGLAVLSFNDSANRGWLMLLVPLFALHFVALKDALEMLLIRYRRAHQTHLESGPRWYQRWQRSRCDRL